MFAAELRGGTQTNWICAVDHDCLGTDRCIAKRCVTELADASAQWTGTGGTANQGGRVRNAGGAVVSDGGASNLGGYAGSDGGHLRDAGSDAGAPNYGSWTVPCPASDRGGNGIPIGNECAITEAGALGTCVSPETALMSPFAPMLGRDTCFPPLYCAPSQLLFDGGVGTWSQCRTTAGLLISLEGRCVPFGLARVPAGRYRLTNDGCPNSFLCVPCYGPIDGTSTGACNGPGNYAREDVPPPAKSCGKVAGGPPGGLCAPRANAESWDLYLSFAQDDCDDGDVCAPATLVGQGWGHCFQRCTTILGSLGPEYGPGACLPAYVVRDLERVAPEILDRGTCNAGELCTPCADPQRPGLSTAACD